jgi:hypothetical protein
MDNILLIVVNQTIIELYYYDKNSIIMIILGTEFVNQKLYLDMAKKYV